MNRSLITVIKFFVYKIIEELLESFWQELKMRVLWEESKYVINDNLLMLTAYNLSAVLIMWWSTETISEAARIWVLSLKILCAMTESSLRS